MNWLEAVSSQMGIVWDNTGEVTQTLVTSHDTIEALRQHWLKIHRYTFTTPEKCKKDFEEWQSEIPNTGCGCGIDWIPLVAANPPDFSSAEAYFEWGVNRHNDVNVKLGKPVVEMDEAYRLHWHQWEYITTDQLAVDTMKLIPKLPQNVNRVIGMHRSGSIPAVIIATALNVPCDIWTREAGLVEAGGGLRSKFFKENYSDGVTLLVDDTVFSGGSFASAKASLKGIKNLSTVAVYARPGSETKNDCYGSTLPEPHLLEWNLFQGWYTHGSGLIPGGIAFDFDGVLCSDPPRVFNEDDESDRQLYLEWIANAPLLNPVRTAEIPLVVSYRCEYTREATQAWLDRHSIRVKRLELWPGEPSSRTWDAREWKGKLYSESECSLFVESSSVQASDIFKVSGKNVLDLETKRILQRKRSA